MSMNSDNSNSENSTFRNVFNSPSLFLEKFRPGIYLQSFWISLQLQRSQHNKSLHGLTQCIMFISVVIIGWSFMLLFGFIFCADSSPVPI